MTNNVFIATSLIIMALIANANDLIRGEWFYNNIYQVFIINGLAFLSLAYLWSEIK